MCLWLGIHNMKMISCVCNILFIGTVLLSCFQRPVIEACIWILEVVDSRAFWLESVTESNINLLTSDYNSILTNIQQVYHEDLRDNNLTCEYHRNLKKGIISKSKMYLPPVALCANHQATKPLTNISIQFKFVDVEPRCFKQISPKHRTQRNFIEMYQQSTVKFPSEIKMQNETSIKRKANDQHYYDLHQSWWGYTGFLMWNSADNVVPS